MTLDKLEIDCPGCGRGTITVSLQDIASQRVTTCSRGCRVKLDDSSGDARKSQRELDKLDSELKKLNRTIRLG